LKLLVKRRMIAMNYKYRRSKRAFTGLALSLTLVLLCQALSMFATGAPAVTASPLPATPDIATALSDPDVEEQVEALLSQMTLDEKIEQLSGNTSLLSLVNGEPSTTPDNERLGIPGFTFTDGPRGVGLNESTCFPVSMARAAAWDRALEEQVGTIIGYEAKAQGANICGAACVNVLRHPGWGRAQETYGADPYLLGTMGQALVSGLQNYAMATVKHFAVNSIENNRFNIDVQMDERTLREVYLRQFEEIVDSDVAAVMAAYNKVNGEWCSENDHLLRDILKGDWGYDGFVMSDWVFGMHSTVGALNAGLDLEMPFAFYYSKLAIKWGLFIGTISQDTVDDAVRRILRAKIRYGLLDEQPTLNPDKVACDEHTEVALEAAREGIVLLENKENALPLGRDTLSSIAVIGNLANKANLGDTGSSQVTPPYAITPLEGIRNAVGDDAIIRYNCGLFPFTVDWTARNADAVIVVVGLTSADEGESLLSAGDRDNLGLSNHHKDLIARAAANNDRVIVVLEGGSAIETEPWREDVEAILMAWYPGMEGGTAIADILFGDVNPSGKLPITFPKSMDQLYEFGSGQSSIEYGYYHDYRYFDKEGLDPQYPFGYGLSYTDFEYSNLRLLSDPKIRPDGTLTVKLKVTNTGNVAGDEIVQLYIGYPNSAVDRPVKELKGFEKLSLAPGEMGQVTMEVEAADLAYYNVQTGTWEVEETDYEVYVGASSRDLLPRVTFTIES
jgi:beta-glucosidase